MKIFAIPFFGAFLEAAGTVLEKRILRGKMDFKSYNVFGFLAIILVLIPCFLILGHFFPLLFSLKIQTEALELKNILIMSAIVVLSILANFFIFYAMKWEKITEIEPIRLFQPLFVIIFAFILYSSERQTATPLIIAAIIASLALILSHIRRHHLKISKYSLAAFLGSIFFAAELAISKEILTFYSPMSFYLIRCLFIFIITYLVFRPKLNSIPNQKWPYVFLVAFIWILYRILLYFSYETKGIIITTLLFILAPVLIYLLSYFYLKEKPNWRNIIAAIVILICVAYAMIVTA
jgi:drug/metabolite transporter (DMT)-like permease